MLPIVLDVESIAIGLAGDGDGLLRRHATLAEAGTQVAAVAIDADAAALRGLSVLFVAGLPREAAARLAAEARLAGVLVNVEDVPELCDFHLPAVLRRGDLLLTASTGGKAPGLAGLLRDWLAERIGEEWDAHLADISAARAAWRKAGHSVAEVSRRMRALVTERGWLR